MRGSRLPAISMLLVPSALVLAGCLGTPKLMTPGAQGVSLQIWGEPGTEPTLLQADRLDQVVETRASDPSRRSTGFEHLRFEGLRVRRPFEQGSVAYLQSPHGEYRKDTDEEIALEGPVRMAGAQDGEPFVGIGERAVLHRASGQVELLGDMSPGAEQDARRQAILVGIWGGVVRSRHFVFDNVIAAGAGQRAPAAPRVLNVTTAPYGITAGRDMPAVSVALAALPHPLVIPEPVVEMR